MPRLFVAIDLPEAVKNQLFALQQDDIPGANGVSRAQMHLTLKFIGEVDPAKFRKIAAALEVVRGAPFEMVLSGVGCFPPQPQQNPNVVWAGVEMTTPLLHLQQNIEEALLTEGIEKDSRRFSPHITLFRIKGRPPRGTVGRFIHQNQGFHSDTFPVTEFALFSSQLRPEGPFYTKEKVYSLR